MIDKINSYRICAYTRNPSPAYSVFLAQSVHLAISSDNGASYKPLFMNYGMLFAKCHYNDENGIVSAGITSVQIDKTESCYIISAKEIIRRQTKNGIFMTSFAANETGKYIRWTTTDFRYFSEPYICDTRLPDDINVIDTSKPIESDSQKKELDIFRADSASIAIDSIIGETLCISDTEIRLMDVILPKSICASSAEEVNSIGATAVYTDGSTHKKRVSWDLSDIDFDKPGTYKITGKIMARHFQFPLEERAWGDPIITYYNDKYYFIGTDDWGGNKMFEAREADTPQGLFASDVKRSVILDYTEGKYESTFWAPEFHVAGGKMCLFCTIGKGSFDPQSHVMILRNGGNILNPSDWSEPKRCVMPDGRYLSTNPLGDGKNGITLDMTYFEVKSRGYIAWSFRTWSGTDSGSMIMFAEVNPEKPWKLLTYPTLLTRPEYGWENVDGTDNNEGPHAIVTDDKIYLSYSGGNASGDTYVVGMLTADTCAELTDMSVWTKSQKPWLASDFVKGELGCGHNGFFTDEYGDTYITYHGHKTLGSSARIDGIRRVQFKPDGSPHLYLSNEQDMPQEREAVSLMLTVK